MRINSDLFSVTLDDDGEAWTYRTANGVAEVSIALPTIDLDGRPVRGTAAVGTHVEAAEPRLLRNGVTERVWEWQVAGEEGLVLRCVTRHAPGDPVLRFRYAWRSDRPRRLTKRGTTHDALELLRSAQPELAHWTEVRLGEFQELVHSYVLREEAIPTHARDAGAEVIGPIVVASNRGATDEGHAVLWAYEHGSTNPDAYLRFRTGAGGQLALNAVKGNYLTGHDIGPDGSAIETVWMEVGAVDTGGVDAMARLYRAFCLDHLSENLESRKPYVFYNTWNHQERQKNWHGKPYLTDMHQPRMLAEIERAHRMGIEVFVIDTGWYERTGDWRVNRQRFPDGLRSVKAELDRRGMKLGLWFDNAAALSSAVLVRHPECVMSKSGRADEPKPIWETEAAHRMCLVSHYWEAFADELIRLHREVGVSYFKWDAIGQYGCDSPEHDHGDATHDENERGERYSFLLPLYLAKIVDRVCAACPEAIVDFDLTEGGRIAGLAFLSAAKFFLVNNGPYTWNYDLPAARIADGNANLFFPPGPANQLNSIASLILGHNGVWGDLTGVSDAGVELFGEWLSAYKRVRDAIPVAPPIRSGAIGGSPEIHEKIDPATGRGAVVAFAMQPGRYEYFTAADRIASPLKKTDGVIVESCSSGRGAKLTFDFAPGQWAHVVLLG